jgi:tRNA (guanine10-N2)-dimethyltransferase
VRLWIELSGEHATLPRAEALAAFEAEGCVIREISWSSKLLRLEATGPVMRAAARLGLAHCVCEELSRGEFEEIRAFARSYELGGKTFRTRARGLGLHVDAKSLEGPLGADFGRTGRVNLRSPSVDFHLLVGDEFLLGRLVHQVDRSGMEARKVTHRSFSLPISLHPKLARALVNLARVPTGGMILDPFCGTGGILLEAARIDLRPIGADLRRTMVLGARKSLRLLAADAAFVMADAGQGPWRSGAITGIATDPPYGRAASTRGEPPLVLYERTFAAFEEALPRTGHVAIVLPTEEAIALGAERWQLLERHTMRVHRSLSRTFCVFAT